MDTEELLVHDGGQGQRAERLHACFVDFLAVLVLALKLEGEVVGQMPAFVVAAQQPEGVWIPDFERPDVQYTLRGC